MGLEEEKVRLIEFGRHAEERSRERGTKPETFTFLGVTHYCSHGRNGQFWVLGKPAGRNAQRKAKKFVI